MNYIVKPCLFDYSTNIRIVEELMKEYPFLSTEIIGRSTLGRGIFSLCVGNAKNSVIYAGGFKGSEQESCQLLLLFVESICRAIKYNNLLCGVDIKRALSQLGISVVPCINPDGIEIASNGFESARNMRKFLCSLSCPDHKKWDANAMGIDISRNFSAGKEILKEEERLQGIDGPCHNGYSGEAAESEAETKALTRLCRLHRFRQCLALHGKGEKISWQYGDNTPKQSSIMAKILADSCSYSPESNASSYGFFSAWFIDEFHSPGFTLKTGNDNVSTDKLYESYQKIEEALTLFMLM